MLGGLRQSFRDYADDMNSAMSYRSEGAPTLESRRMRRRSISFTPEIGDDIVRDVRAMNEKLKQQRLLKEQGDEGSASSHQNVSNFDAYGNDEVSVGSPAPYDICRKQFSSQKAISLPSSPHQFRGQSSDRSEPSTMVRNPRLVSTWKKVLESSKFQNKPVLPFHEWIIDFSELTIGIRVGIGFFGEVFRGIWNGTDVVIKIFLKQDLTTENMEDFCNEISIPASTSEWYSITSPVVEFNLSPLVLI
ncbi:hypothetical protein MKX01_030939 [Papaver californicum]|nr:hypothetical protein MKX01_030939 [Papaver californicum]